MNVINPTEHEHRFEHLLGNLLRVGVLLAAGVVLFGGIVYLARHAGEPPDPKLFQGDPAELRSPFGIVDGAVRLSGRGIIQLGLLILIATPVARVAFSAIGFARERDWIYVGLTLIVLAVLLYSLFIGEAM